MSDTINYGQLMHGAFRQVIRQVLTRVAEEGLPGAHHFYISFDTQAPGVQIADWLVERYPEELTIVLQNWFQDLEVMEDGFAVTLSFGNQPEPLYVPFDALLTFVDPSVEFGLKFDQRDLEVDEVEEDEEETPEEKPSGEAEIVSLDQFRK